MTDGSLLQRTADGAAVELRVAAPDGAAGWRCVTWPAGRERCSTSAGGAPGCRCEQAEISAAQLQGGEGPTEETGVYVYVMRECVTVCMYVYYSARNTFTVCLFNCQSLLLILLLGFSHPLGPPEWWWILLFFHFVLSNTSSTFDPHFPWIFCKSLSTWLPVLLFISLFVLVHPPFCLASIPYQLIQ